MDIASVLIFSGYGPARVLFPTTFLEIAVNYMYSWIHRDVIVYIFVH